MIRKAPESPALGCMIVGGHKCGTTSLKEYLGAHPEVATHPQLEFTAFSRKGHSEGSEAAQLDKLLEEARGRLALAKHAGMYADTFALDRLSTASPSCKLLLILRDPVARARSAFRMESLGGEAQRPFDEDISRVLAMEREGNADWRAHVYLRMGLYGMWLGEIQRRFPENGIKVLFLEELEEDPESIYRETCDWLGLSTDFSPNLDTRHNVGADPRSAFLARSLKRMRSEGALVKRAARRVLPEATYLRVATMARSANRTTRRSESAAATKTDVLLREYFAEDSEELRRRLGRNLPWLAARSVP